MIQAAKTQAPMPETAQEPTMEEILASIRRIIADDDIHRQVADAPAASQESSQARMSPQAQMSHQAEAAPAARRPERVEAVAVIAPVEPVSSAPAMENRVESRAEGYVDPAFRSGAIFAKADAAAGAETAPEMTSNDIARQAAPGEGRVASDDLEATVRQLTASMNQHLLSANTAKAVDSAFQVLAQNVLAQNARTLEDLMQDMLRPLLKSWLDDNLPTLVERLVRAEIERVSRGRVS
jgi:cell pole-organizing protein PopZ